MTVTKAIKALNRLIEHKEEKARVVSDPSQSWNKNWKEDDLPLQVAETITELLYQDIGYLEHVIKELKSKRTTKHD